ncbi:MAG: arginyltransferase [Pseudomonadales bacterium]|nr:arginyltransferase [Pseudomonadales bacterium]
MTALKDIRLFTTQSHPCSYLPERKARTLFIDPEYEISSELYTHLSEIGFRRSGSHMYRPQCDHCQHCIPCRVVVADFSPNKRFRRILKKNADLNICSVNSIRNSEFYTLYASYINTRHRDGDMYPATWEQYESFLANTCESTRFYAIRQGEKLLAVLVNDLLDNALSAIYTFYDVTATHRSLGSYAILWQIEEARRAGLPYLYLGYWIKDCDKMNYKTQYRPLEMRVRNHWVRVN